MSTAKRKLLDVADSCGDVAAVSNKLSHVSSVVDECNQESDVDDASSSHCEDDTALIMIRRYCIIFADDADDSWFVAADGATIPPVVARVEAIASRACAAAATNGQELVPHKYTMGVEPYALNIEDGELWCSIPESAVDEIVAEFGGAIEAIVEEYAF